MAARPSRMRFKTTLGIVVSGALVLGALAVPAGAAPVCAPPAEGLPSIPEAACGGRIFAEAMNSLTFVQHDSGEYERGIKALQAAFPRYVKVTTLAEKLDDPAAVSAGGRDIWIIEITDFEQLDGEEIPVAVSLSAHGLERAGLEGGVRYAEDLARWATTDPNRELRNGVGPGTTGVPISQALDDVHLYLANINPDGWASGDLQNGGRATRGNENGVDLNREFPTKGWTRRQYTPLSESESISWARFIEMIEPEVAADLHGETTSVNDAFADIMLPAAQWDPLEQLREDTFARHMVSNIERYFELDGVVLGDVMAELQGMRPAAYATGYDVVGYDASGFMGDWFAEQIGALELDVEHFLSNAVPDSFFLPPLEAAHVAAVRGEIETLMVEALVTDQVDLELDLGRVGYLFDPQKTTDADANGYGGPVPPEAYSPQSYSATRMKYFEDLSRFTTSPLRPVPIAEVGAGGLAGLDSFVISDVAFPEDPQGRPFDRAAVVDSLDEWVQGGGNLVLTDGAVPLIADLGIVDEAAISSGKYEAGHINIDDFTHPFTTGLPDTASQTYYEVPLGYSIDVNASPHWGVATAAWEAAGGVHVASSGNADDVTTLGTIEQGDGIVSFLGAVLPRATEQFDHFYGIADYGVTVTGGHILNQMIAAGR